MSLPMLAVTTVGALALLGLTGVIGVVISAIHSQDLTIAGACRCWACLLAYRLDRHHGRHRLEDRSFLDVLHEADRVAS